MVEHRYTVKEIDDLRSAVSHRLTWGCWPWDDRWSGEMRGTNIPNDLNQRVEDQLRTYMLAGLTIESMRAEAAEATEPARGREMG